MSSYVKSNSCGLVLFLPGRSGFAEGDRFELTDYGSDKTYVFTNNNLPIKTTPTCRGNQLQGTVWSLYKTAEGAIGVSGLTPNSAQTFRMLDQGVTRAATTNSCGFLRIKLPSPKPQAIFLDGMAFPTNVNPGAGLVCNNGKLYKPIPPSESVSPISESTWKAQNLLQFTSAQGIPLVPTITQSDSESPPAIASEPTVYLDGGYLVFSKGQSGKTYEVFGDSGETISMSQTADACGRVSFSLEEFRDSGIPYGLVFSDDWNFIWNNNQTNYWMELWIKEQENEQNIWRGKSNILPNFSKPSC